MHYHTSFKYDPAAGPLTVKLMQPFRAASQLDLWNGSHGLMSEFCVDQHDWNKNRSQIWTFDPIFWSKWGNVLECWGINGDHSFKDGERFDATVEVFQAGECLSSLTRNFTVEDDDKSFHLRLKFKSILDSSEDELDYFDSEDLTDFADAKAAEGNEPTIPWDEVKHKLNL